MMGDYSKDSKRRRIRLRLSLLLAPLLFALATNTASATSSSSSSSSPSLSDDHYAETLSLQQYPDGKVLLSQTFTTTTGVSPDSTFSLSHYRLFPRTLGDILQSFQVQELHLSFTQGRWDTHNWGFGSPRYVAPSGVQLWAWMVNRDNNWKKLTNALAGLLCGSLNFMNLANTANPTVSFGKQGQFDLNWNGSTPTLFYSALPREAVCTENLTPWLKLLPCQSKAGLGNLMNAYKLYDSAYHSMSIHVRPVCADKDCTEKRLELVQDLTVVLDPLRTRNTQSWSILNLVGRSVSRVCPSAKSTRVLLTLPDVSHKEQYSLLSTIGDGHFAESTNTLEFALTHDNVEGFDMGLTWNKTTAATLFDTTHSPLQIHRHVTGFGQERGGLSIVVTNHLLKPVAFTYFQPTPWWLKLWLHTLRVSPSTAILSPDTDSQPSPVLKDTYYSPSIDRIKPSVLELSLKIPANSTIRITMDFDIAFLKYTEHPPDAHRGFDVSAGVVSISSCCHTKYFNNTPRPIRIFTTPLLIRLPTPDFSMPYNVITLTCTLIALFFGTVYNGLVRKFTPVIVNEKVVEGLVKKGVATVVNK